MAASAESLALAQQYRQRVLDLREVFLEEFAKVWAATLDPAALAATTDLFLELTIALVQRWRPVFQTTAADYYLAAATLDTAATPVIGGAPLGATGATAVSLLPLAAGRVVTSLAATGLGMLRRALRQGLPLAEVEPEALEAAAQSAARLALDAGRQQIERLVEQDRRALGWMRITDGDPCAFCLTLASRGPVYRSAESAGFQLDPVRGEINRFHDNCACQVVPVFTKNPVLPESTIRAQQIYETAIREARESGELRRGTSNDALNAVRRHLAALQREE